MGRGKGKLGQSERVAVSLLKISKIEVKKPTVYELNLFSS